LTDGTSNYATKFRDDIRFPGTAGNGPLPNDRLHQGPKKRTPVQMNFDATRLVLLADAFNLFNQQRVLDHDNHAEISFHVTNPNFGRIIAYQTPRTSVWRAVRVLTHVSGTGVGSRSAPTSSMPELDCD
jgi:hypothetical protein